MLTLLSFIAVIIIVVSVHEGGHYLAARAFGVRVLRFSVGFGKPLWLRKDKHGTEWVLAPIPLGGYVRMLDKDAGAQPAYPKHEYLESLPQGKRIVIYAAGPFANFVLSLLVLMVFLLSPERGVSPIVGEVYAESAAADAGMVEGEVLLSINDEPTPVWRHVELAMVDALLTEAEITIATENDKEYILLPSEDALGAIERGERAAGAVGLAGYTDYVKPIVASVLAGSAADAGGLQKGDRFVAINDEVHERWLPFLQAITARPNEAVTLIMWREESTANESAANLSTTDAAGAGFAYTTIVTLDAATRGNETIGRLGVAPVWDEDDVARIVVTVNRTFSRWLRDSFYQTYADIARTLSFLKLLIVGRMSAEQLSGPIGIAVYSGEAAERGINTWLRFLALISTSLGILNLLPLPLLDGGHIVISVVQIASRRQLPDWFLRRWDMAGVGFLLVLTAWVIFNDITRLL